MITIARQMFAGERYRLITPEGVDAGAISVVRPNNKITQEMISHGEKFLRAGVDVVWVLRGDGCIDTVDPNWEVRIT